MAWEHSPCSVPCGFAARKVAALESHAAVPALHRLITCASSPARLLSRYFLHLCYSSEFMPCALTPAYGVTSICRFVQAVTALSIVPTVDRSSPLLSLGLLAVLFGLLSISFCHPSRHIASAFPHVNRRYFSALHPVFQQLVPTAAVYCYTPLPLVVLRYAPLMVFVEGGGVEPPPRLAVLPALSTFPLGQPSFAVVPCAYPQGPSFVYCPAIPSRHPATTPVALAAVVFFVFTSPFSSPFMIILLILCFG